MLLNAAALSPSPGEFFARSNKYSNVVIDVWDHANRNLFVVLAFMINFGLACVASLHLFEFRPTQLRHVPSSLALRLSRMFCRQVQTTYP